MLMRVKDYNLSYCEWEIRALVNDSERLEIKLIRVRYKSLS